MAENPKGLTPQETLKKASLNLDSALCAAAESLEHPDATPRHVGIAMQALASAQQAWNAAVSGVPLRMMEGGVAPEDEQPMPETSMLDLAADLQRSTNPRKWADAFLAANKNHAIDREALTEWFQRAINAGLLWVRSTE
jgi:hypothetical protein